MTTGPLIRPASRLRCVLLLLTLPLACSKNGGGNHDLGLHIPDMAVARGDLAVTGAADLATAADLAPGPDGAPPSVDMARTFDLLQPGVWVDPVNGSDTNDGSAAHPLKTVKKASQTISAGETVYLLPGTYDSSNQTTMTITFPADTALRAVTPGSVTFDYAGAGFTFNGGSIQDVAIHNFSQSGFALLITGGTFSTHGVAFSGVGCPVATTGGSDATVTIDMTGVATPIANVPDAVNCLFVWAEGTSNVTWKGGGTVNRTWVSVPAAAGIFARATATVSIDGITIDHYPTSGVTIDDNAHVTLRNSTIHDSGGSGSYAVQLGGSNTQTVTNTSLTLDGTSVTASHGPAVNVSVYSDHAETIGVTLTNSHLDGSSSDGLRVQGTTPTNAGLALAIVASGSTFKSNAGNGITGLRANVTITGGEISSNGGAGLIVSDAAEASAIKMRGTTLASNGSDFVSLAGSASSSLDLGKTGDLGGVSFSGVSNTFSAVKLSAAITGYAVGNTWIASQEGADAGGKYTAATTLAAGAAGLNATVGAGASLVVAQ